MKKKIIMLMVGILLIGVNIYAAGDLIVNGKLGVGTSTPTVKLDIAVTDTTAIKASPTKTNTTSLTAMQINATDSYSGSAVSSSAQALSVFVDHTGTPTGGYAGASGANYQVRYMGSGNVTSGSYAQQNQLTFRSNNNYSVTNLLGNSVQLTAMGSYTGAHTITNYYGFYSLGTAISQTLNGTNWRHAYFADFPNFGGTVTNVSGLWIDKQTYGSNNYGVVLNGDGAGADIVFGTGNNVKLYASAGDLYVKDAGNNVTLLGPHDPVTGEWIFFSKNLKTGKVVRVEMEKLVKAVEKLTGEKFMVESIMSNE